MLFARNLSAFLLGLTCQVLAGVFPKLSGALLVPASLLLSGADIRSVLNGSFTKHLTLFVLAVLCQVGASLAPAAWNVAVPLLAAGGILMSASDIKRVLKGPETPTAPLVTTAADSVSTASKETSATGPTLKSQMDSASEANTPSLRLKTPLSELAVTRKDTKS
jgi:hypothetical protein